MRRQYSYLYLVKEIEYKQPLHTSGSINGWVITIKLYENSKNFQVVECELIIHPENPFLWSLPNFSIEDEEVKTIIKYNWKYLLYKKNRRRLDKRRKKKKKKEKYSRKMKDLFSTEIKILSYGIGKYMQKHSDKSAKKKLIFLYFTS